MFRLTVPVPSASGDGLFYGRYPHGTAPVGPWSGAAADSSSGSGSLSTGIKLAGSPASTSNASAALTAGASLAPAPRFGWMNTGGNSGGQMTMAQAQRLARADACINGLNYEGVGSLTYTGSADSFVKAIQSFSACGTLVLQYFLPDADIAGIGAYPNTGDHIVSTNNWFCYRAGTSGTKTQNYFNASWNVANSSTYTPTDSNGHHLEDAAAQFFYQYLKQGTYGGPSQSTDFMSTLAGSHHDNAFLRTPLGGGSSLNSGNPCDWNRDGTADYQGQTGSPTGAAVDQAYRNGLALWPSWFASNAPSLITIGNLAGWGDPTAVDGQGNDTAGTNVTGVDHLWQGGMLEGLLGLSFGEETYNPTLAVSMYQYVQTHATGSKNVGLAGPAAYWNSSGLDYYTTTNGSPTAWQAPRHHLCFCLMDDGMAWIGGDGGSGWSNPAYNVNNFTWLDEFCVNPSTMVATGESSSTSGKGYMGLPIDAPWTQLGNGVYARRYGNSATGQTWVAFMNPQGNGSKTFNVATYYPGLRLHKFTGTQASSINNGAAVTSVTLQDRDGLIGVLAA